MALINLENFPNGMVSGIDDDELDFFTVESSSRFLKELSNEFLKEFDDFESEQFEDISATTIEEMDKEESAVIPPSTKLSTEREAKKFKHFLIENNLSDKIESMPASVLSKYLRFYYFKLHAKNGKPYAPRTLISIRAAIHRYLVSPAVNRNINIIKDNEFQRPNAMLKARVAQYLKSGEKEKQFPSIQDTDFQKLNEYFTRRSPTILQEEVWFVLTYYLGLRGRELHHCIQRQWLEIGTDSSNRRYVRIKHNYLSKNVKASLKQKEFENLEDGRIYDNVADEEHCPVKAVETYLQRIPNEQSFLYPLPSKCFKEGDPTTWYCKTERLGKNSIGQMMPKRSEAAGLSMRYT